MKNMKRFKSNVKNSDNNAGNILSESLKVQPISATSINASLKSTNKEKDKKTEHFNEFKRVYGSILREPTSHKYQDKTGLTFCISNSRMNTNETAKPNVGGKMIKSPLKSNMRMVEVEVPRFGTGQAIVVPKLKQNTDRKIRKKPDTKQSASVIVDQLKKMGVKDEKDNVLEDVNEEIDISKSQLEQIQNLLKITREANKTPVENTTWNVPKKEKRESSKVRVLSTLNTLNKKLQDMQEKYFGQPKIHYKSVKDIGGRSNSQKSYHTICNKELPTVCQRKEVPRVVELHKNPKILDIDIDIDKQHFSAGMEKPSVEDYDFYQFYPRYYDDEDSASRPRTTVFDNSEPKFSTDEDTSLFEESKYEPTGYIAPPSPKKQATQETQQSIFDNTDLQACVLKSEYLMKSFNIDPTGNFSEVDQARLAKKNSDRYFRNNKLDRKNYPLNVPSLKHDRALYASLEAALKNSFYTTAPPEGID